MTAQALQNTWSKFSLPGQCIMDEKGLEAAGYDVLRTMSQENVRYAESVLHLFFQRPPE